MADKDDKLDIEIGIADKSIKDFEEAIVRGGERLGANVAGGSSSRGSANNPLFEKNKALSNFEKEQLRLQVQYYREKAKEEVRYNNQQIENQKQFNKEKIKKEEEAKGHYRSVFRVLKNTAISNIFAKSLWGVVGFAKNTISSGMQKDSALNQFRQTMTPQSYKNFNSIALRNNMTNDTFNQYISAYDNWQTLENRGLDLDPSIMEEFVKISKSTNINLTDLVNSYIEAIHGNPDKYFDLLSSKDTKHLIGDSARAEFSMRITPKERAEYANIIARKYQAKKPTTSYEALATIQSKGRNLVSDVVNETDRASKLSVDRALQEKKKRLSIVSQEANRKYIKLPDAIPYNVNKSMIPKTIEQKNKQEYLDYYKNHLKQVEYYELDAEGNIIKRILHPYELMDSKTYELDLNNKNMLRKLQSEGFSYNNNLDKDNILLLTNSINSLSYKLNTSVPPIINNGSYDNMMG